MSKAKKTVSVKTADASTQKHADGLANFVARVGLGTDNVLSSGTYVPYQITQNRLLLENIYRNVRLITDVHSNRINHSVYCSLNSTSMRFIQNPRRLAIAHFEYLIFLLSSCRIVFQSPCPPFSGRRFRLGAGGGQVPAQFLLEK
jgi:hypothetical protein